MQRRRAALRRTCCASACRRGPFPRRACRSCRTRSSPRDSNDAITCSPSVAADADAHVPFSGCDASCGVSSLATRSQTTLPVLRSSAMTTYLCATGVRPSGACAAAPSTVVGTAVVTKTRSPQTTGVAEPRPGISTFQRMFFPSAHSRGGVAVLDTPVACGPRHCGQKRSAAAGRPGRRASARPKTNRQQTEASRSL